MYTPVEGAKIFYTRDGSTATEASIEYVPDNPISVAAGTTINAAVVRKTSGGNMGVTVQNGQATTSDWKTMLSSSEIQSAPYVSSYITPRLDYGPGNNTCADGVCGIPTQIGMLPNQFVPSVTPAYSRPCSATCGCWQEDTSSVAKRISRLAYPHRGRDRPNGRHGA
jgi:hypothetical protein